LEYAPDPDQPPIATDRELKAGLTRPRATWAVTIGAVVVAPWDPMHRRFVPTAKLGACPLLRPAVDAAPRQFVCMMAGSFVSAMVGAVRWARSTGDAALVGMRTARSRATSLTRLDARHSPQG